VEAHGLADRVRIEPVTDDPYSWHAVADLLVCASDIESLPRVILEAMAFGTPVLSTRVYGVPELIEDGRTGYLCEMRDTAALAAALDRVLGAAPDELASVARAASERVRKRHDPERYAARLAGLLTDLATERGSQGDPLARASAAPPAPTGRDASAPSRSYSSS
jgi:glycosyltransferase involved in cell wall biosynthesis